MKLFNNNKNNLTSLEEKPFKLEREIQQLFEANLALLTGYQFIKSEFSIKGFRIDTLAFDSESNSFVIIEYKKVASQSVVDQGFTYLGLALEHKADFVLEYNESQKNSLKRTDVDWTQCRVLFVSPSFTDYQKQASNFKDLPIELWEIKRFENDLLVINPIKKDKATASFKQLKQADDSEIAKIAKEIKVYTEEEHLEGKAEEVIELYEAFKQGIVQLAPDVEIQTKKLYIAFKKNKNIADIVILKNSLKIFINKRSGELDDAKKLMRDVSNIGHWGNGDYEVIVSNTDNLEYIMSLIKQTI